MLQYARHPEKSKAPIPHSSMGIQFFKDLRQKKAAQLKLQQAASESTQQETLKQLQKKADAFSAAQQKPVQAKTNNTGLPDKLKSGIENLSGQSMDDVKVHYNSNKPAQLNAHAYAQGTQIHIASGQEKHLAHEAWHVVQQKQGRVKPTRQLKGKVAINNEKHLEKEADVMGAKAMQHPIQQVAKKLETAIGSQAALLPVQRIPKNKATYKGKRVEDHANKGTIVKKDGNNKYFVLFDGRNVPVSVLAEELSFISESDVDIDAKMKELSNPKKKKKKKKNKKNKRSKSVMLDVSFEFDSPDNSNNGPPEILPVLSSSRIRVKHGITPHGSFNPSKTNKLYKQTVKRNQLINFVRLNRKKFFFKQYDKTGGDTYNFHLGFDNAKNDWWITIDYYPNPSGAPYGIITHFGPFGGLASVGLY